jgi:DNA polymerase V
MLTAARQLVAARWRSGVPFAKAGVCLLDLVAPAHAQEDLFSRVPSDADTPLMAAVDRINRKFGRNTLRFGTQALAPEANWQMRQAALSPRYTTRWEDVTRTDCRKGAA